MLFPLLPQTSLTLAPSPQTELSLQKEQLQLKIIEIEDEAEKWQKEKDRIKVSRPWASALLYSHPSCSAWEKAGISSCSRPQVPIYTPHLFLLGSPTPLASPPIPLLSRGQAFRWDLVRRLMLI